eukprot:sb/3464393/
MLTTVVFWYCFIQAAYSAPTTSEEWQPVVRGTLIEWDLESVPLQVKTDAPTSSAVYILVYFYGESQATYVDSEANYQPLTSLLISSSVVSNYLGMCHHRATLPIQPAAEDPMIWTFYKTDDSFSIECNGVMLVSYTFDSCQIGNSNWKGDTIGKIGFSPTHDTASNFYRAKPFNCSGFSIPGSTVENWDDHPLGTTVTVQCKENHVLLGNEVTTCLESGEWSEAILPVCKKCTSIPLRQEPTDTSKQPIRTRYLGHVTGYQPIRDEFLPGSIPLSISGRCWLLHSHCTSPLRKQYTWWRCSCLCQATYVDSEANYQPLTSLLISSSVVSNYLGMCHHRATLPIQPAAEDPMIWTFYKTDDSFSIECNGVMLVSYTFDSCQIGNSNWKGDTIGKIGFSPTHDTASNFYRASIPLRQEPTDTSKQPIRTRYLGHVTGYQPIRDEFLPGSIPLSISGRCWLLHSHCTSPLRKQ